MEWLQDFDTVQLVAQMVVDTIGIWESARDEDYGFVFEGFVQVPEDGIYAFSVNSDDGSKLYVADTLVADNDGLHGDHEETGLIGLKTGYHRIAVYMFQLKGGETLGVSVAGPSMPRQAVPTTMLYH